MARKRARKIAIALVSALTAGAGGWLVATLFPAGFLVTYLAYEVLHRRAHTHPPRGVYTHWARRHHFYHHFHNPNVNHGVTTPVWNLVFRTYVRPEKVRVPGRHAMDWLTVPETGEVRPAYVDDYEGFRPTARQPLPLPGRTTKVPCARRPPTRFAGRFAPAEA